MHPTGEMAVGQEVQGKGMILGEVPEAEQYFQTTILIKNVKGGRR